MSLDPAIASDGNLYSFPILYGVSIQGKIKEWDIRVIRDAFTKEVCIQTIHGYLDGAKQVDTCTISEGKNLGKSNETSPLEQAVSEAQSKWNKKRDANYTPHIPDPSKGPGPKLRPMLAQPFSRSRHRISFPAWVQPKLDGVRLLAERVCDSIVYHSRGGKEFTTLQHLDEQLLALMEDGEVWDGELYIHETSFQAIVSAVKATNPLTKQLQYWVYDIANPSQVFDARLCQLAARISNSPLAASCNLTGFDPIGSSIVLVDTFPVVDEEAVYEYHTQFTRANFEGTIIRNRAGCYALGQRSHHLQKHKSFIDGEFEIIGFTDGVGREEGCVIWICQTITGASFKVRPMGTQDARQRLYYEGQDYVGKMLTVRYQRMSDDNIPIFPTGVTVRDYE